MGLAETDAAVNEQRIIRARRRLRDGKTGCMRNFVVWTDDERFERVPRIESGNGCPWPRVYDLRRQRFLHRGCIVRRRLRTRCRRGAKLYRTGRAKCGDDRILQRRHVITLDPKLIDVVCKGKLDRFYLLLHKLNGGKPAIETTRANLWLERSRQPLPQLRAFFVHSKVVNSVTQMPHCLAPWEIPGSERLTLEPRASVILLRKIQKNCQERENTRENGSTRRPKRVRQQRRAH